MEINNIIKKIEQAFDEVIVDVRFSQIKMSYEFTIKFPHKHHPTKDPLTLNYSFTVTELFDNGEDYLINKIKKDYEK